jgi:TonB-linked SusC/RagA family outer membrane protein
MKKKLIHGLSHDLGIVHKIWLTMRLIVLLLFISLVHVSASVYSQKTKLNIKVENATLQQVFNLIQDQSEFDFFYKNEQIPADARVSVDAKNETVEAILNNVLKDTDLKFGLVDKDIVIIPKVPGEVSQQQKKILGKVTDSSGATLPGVSIVVKGTSTGVITDINGKYALSNIPENATLQFSFVGMKSQEILIGTKTIIDITLVEDAIGLEEVVAIGYGTQKKVNLTGSVASISPKELESRPITQASQALAGLISGVTVSQGSGSPGNDASLIIIRGMGTFSSAGNAPLVLVDGLASSIDAVDPNNIESVSVLKDAASASIYGTRAANGVILIETKRGQKTKLQVSYNNYVGWQKVTALPQFLDSWEYATLKNEAAANMGLGIAYTADQIAKFKSGSDPDNYPNASHLKDLVNSGSGFQTNHNVSFMGGDEKNSYLFSLGYLHQDGIVAKNKYDKYNFLLNFDSKIKNNLNLKVDLSGSTDATEQPGDTRGMTEMISFAAREPAVYAGKKSDGTYGYQANFAPEAWLASNTFFDNTSKNFLGGVELSWEIFKGLTLSGKAGYKYNNYTNTTYLANVVFDQYKTVGPSSLTVNPNYNSLLTLQSLLQYTKKLNQHSFNVLFGISQESYREDGITASRDNFPNNLLYEMSAGASSNMQSSGTGAEWALGSYFGRLNYSFKEKYLFEANARYDGTSRFPPKNRWGLFPSFSAGWRISQESFIKDNAKWIDNLKLRVSWGKLGNQNIGNYPYQNVLSLGQNYSLGGVLVSGAMVTTLANSDITWESTQVADIGLDLTVLKGKLSMVIDYFDKNTSGILYNISVSNVLGLTPSTTNAGEVRNRGYELLLNYQTSIGKVKIGVIPNFSYVKTEVTKLASVQQDIAKGLFVGQPLGALYGYVADGLFVDANDIASYPKQPYAAEPGFVRYKDISGPNGVPDGKVDATYDQKVIGSTFPKYSYGATITADFKGFDFSLLLQGLGGYEQKMGWYENFAFINDGNIQRWQADNRWTVANPNPNAKYIKLTNLPLTSGTCVTSTFWDINASFLRLKNLQVGYTIPNRIIRKTQNK